MEERDYSKMPESDIVINYIAARKSKGLYTLCFLAGLPGSGKSSSCIRLAELTSEKLLGKNIITEENVVDDLLSFIKFVKEADPNKVCICVLEEVSVLFPSRRAMAGENVTIGKILDTARKKQVILFANAPLWTSIDSHLRALGNIYIEALRINKTQGVVISKALRLQTNPGTGKTYFHFLRRRGKEVHRVITKKPNQETWDKYEAKKDKAMDDLYKREMFRTQQKQDKLDKDMAKAGGKLVKPLTDRELEVYQLYYREKLNQTQISKELGLSNPRINIILKNIKKKMDIARDLPKSSDKKGVLPS